MSVGTELGMHDGFLWISVGLLTGEFIGKYNRLMEILREDPSIPFVSRYFRK
jgi:hypothetical protein